MNSNIKQPVLYDKPTTRQAFALPGSRPRLTRHTFMENHTRTGFAKLLKAMTK